MLLALYAASALVPIIIALALVVSLVIRKSPQAVVCIECQQCKGVCPLFDRGLNPSDVMRWAKTGESSLELIESAQLCLHCGKCRETCPRGLAAYLEADKLKDTTEKNGQLA